MIKSIINKYKVQIIVGVIFFAILFFVILFIRVIVFIKNKYKDKGIGGAIRCLIQSMKNKYRKQGIIGVIRHIILFELLETTRVFLFGREIKKKGCIRRGQSKIQENLLEKWEDLWIGIAEYSEEDEIFFKIFLVNYSFVKWKAEINKKKNFRAKTIFVVVLFLESVGLIALIGYIIKTSVEHLDSVADSSFFIELIKIMIENGIIAIGLYIFSRIVAKWIDVKKYQETWARHSQHLYRIEKEMSLYILRMFPYSTNARKNKRLFQERVFEIWDANQEKFIKNLEDKEEALIKKQ